MDNAASTSANGFLFRIVPRNSVRVDDEDDPVRVHHENDSVQVDEDLRKMTS